LAERRSHRVRSEHRGWAVVRIPTPREGARQASVGPTVRGALPPGAGLERPAADRRRPARKEGRPNMTAIVTGAAGGLGPALARAFATEGKRLLLVDVRKQPLHDIAEVLASDGVEVEPLVADLTTRADIERVARAIEMRRDREVIVNNAGFGQRGLLAE